MVVDSGYLECFQVVGILWLENQTIELKEAKMLFELRGTAELVTFLCGSSVEEKNCEWDSA